MLNRFSRRTFARLFGSAALAPTVLPALSALPAEAQPTAPAAHRFPQGFLWGSATASYQVEGAVNEEGRGPSIWDTFSHTPGKIKNNDTGDVADDHFHRYKEDIALMKDLGLKTYRFSVAWPRVFPQGTGTPNPKGLDFYNRMLDTLLAAGIQPYCTLFHWDLPQALEDKGGWQSRDTSEAFANYAGYVAERLSDRVKHFMTLNEMSSFVDLGYRDGRHAPGLNSRPPESTRSATTPSSPTASAYKPSAPTPSPAPKSASPKTPPPASPSSKPPNTSPQPAKAYREVNAGYLTAVMEGRYTDAYLHRAGADAPKFHPRRHESHRLPPRLRRPQRLRPSLRPRRRRPRRLRRRPAPASFPHMMSSWLHVGPEALYWSPKLASQLWNIKEIYITENGASSADVLTPDGQVFDTDRVMYLRNYLTQLHRAVSEGVPVRGYFCWSLMDNYEWADGYQYRFGIHYVDFTTQKRTPKLSAHFYKEVIARNGLA